MIIFLEGGLIVIKINFNMSLKIIPGVYQIVSSIPSNSDSVLLA